MYCLFTDDKYNMNTDAHEIMKDNPELTGEIAHQQVALASKISMDKWSFIIEFWMLQEQLTKTTALTYEVQYAFS